MNQKTRLVALCLFFCFTQTTKAQSLLQVGADQTSLYLPLLKNKNVALMVNPSSMIGASHLVDSLQSLGVRIKKIFTPEHGFRGTADAGELVLNSVDQKTGLPIISLYGKSKIPTKDQVNGIDLIIFDIQDVGVRFFTYVGSMHYLMQACANYGIPLLVLDRPNPNGHYVDGPVLDMAYKSFIGMHPVPVVHGLTVGEYAIMINGEKWLDSAKTSPLTVIPMKGYTHKMPYSLPIKPSPNLPNDLSIQLYPSICFFEGTSLSLGRGTDAPFQIIGGPNKAYGEFQFMPKSTQGAKNPILLNTSCYGVDLRTLPAPSGLDLSYLVSMYKRSPTKDTYFIPFFTKLAGTQELRKQLESGSSLDEIKKSWEPKLSAYKAMRKKYLLYEDF